jgi:hypothetical protein
VRFSGFTVPPLTTAMPPRKSTKSAASRASVAPLIPESRPEVFIKPRSPFFTRPPVVIAILGTMLLCGLYLWVAQPTPTETPAPQPYQANQGEQPNTETQTEDAVARVSGMILVNTDENPQVFTVSDAGAFREQTPQAGPVQEGDKVIAWTDKTVVYSPMEDKIIAVYPTVPPAPPTPESDATVEIRNASGVAGAAAKLKKSLTDAGLAVSAVGDAATRQVGTMIIDLSNGAFPNALAKLSSLSVGEVTSALPAGEPTSDAKILILIGK